MKPHRQNERGQILIVTAVSLVMLLSIMALAIDASFMYDKRNQLHAAADAAAKVGAIELRRNPSITITELERFAGEQVNALGLTAAACGATSGAGVCINHPPVNGPFNCANLPGDCNSFVEAIVTQQTKTFFATVLGRFSMTPAARAVAGVSPGPNCMVVFDHVLLDLNAATNVVHMETCSLVINGQASPPHDLNNDGTIYARTIGVVHEGPAGCTGNCGGVTYGVAPATDPLGTLAPLDLPQAQTPPLATPTCTTPFQVTVLNTAISPADVNSYYCGWNFYGGSLVLGAGNYYINGPITAQTPGTNVLIDGTAGVMVYLSAAGGRIDLDSNQVDLTMNAANAGPYNGILFYQDRATPNYQAIFGKNVTNFAIRGAFYFPTATLQLKNENSATLTNPCMVIVAWAIEVDKANFELNNACLGFAGSPLMSLAIVE